MSKKLLLADDSITIQKVIGITFANEDFELSVVDNGDTALEKAREAKPDLILADVFMPGKNGYELCAAVRQDPTLRHIPVLLLTGTFEPFDEIKARTVGADSWIAKPFESQALIDRVEELLAKVPEPALPAASAPAAAPASPPVPAAVVPAAVTAPVPDADIWGDLADAGDLETEPLPAADFSVVDAPVAVVENVTAEAELPTEDDIWGDVTFDEEDLLAGEAAGAGAEDIWGALEEESVSPAPPAVFADEAFSFAEEEETLADEPALTGSLAPSHVEEFVFDDEEDVIPPSLTEDAELLEEDILPLEELEILEEEELDETAAASSAETFIFAEQDAPEAAEAAAMAEEPGELPFFAEAVLPEEPSIAVEDTFALVEDGPEWGIAEAPEVGIEPSAPADEVFFITPAEAAQPPEAMPSPVAAAVVETQARALTDEELALIVERVAGSVIERLAGSVLERIAWEVVPDLAESLVKEEIRKIRQEAQ